MIASCALPLLLLAGFAVLVPCIGRRVGPSWAVWILSAGSLTLALCGVAAIGAVAALGLGQLPPLAHFGHWSAAAVASASPFRTPAECIAIVLLCITLMRGAVVSLRHLSRLRMAWSASREAPPGLVVLSDDRPFAFAVPGWPGRVVASRGLLQALDGRERRAVLTHEATHLRERHDLHLTGATVAAAINPLFRRVPAALSLACERRADEKAVEAVGDRSVVARAIAAAVHPTLSGIEWAASGADVTRRLDDLMGPEPRRARILSAVLVLVVIGTVVCSAGSVLWLGHDLRSVLVAAR